MRWRDDTLHRSQIQMSSCKSMHKCPRLQQQPSLTSPFLHCCKNCISHKAQALPGIPTAHSQHRCSEQETKKADVRFLVKWLAARNLRTAGEFRFQQVLTLLLSMHNSRPEMMHVGLVLEELTTRNLKISFSAYNDTAANQNQCRA